MNAELKNGSFILYNASDMLGIEIHYSGQITIDPKLPQDWICRANTNTILIFSLGNNKLNIEQELFTYTGTLNVKYAFATPNGKDKKNISVANPKRNWDNIYFKDADFTSLTEDWDSIQSKNKSNIKKGYTSIVNQNHIKQTNKLLQAEKPKQTPSATTTRTTRTTTTGGY